METIEHVAAIRAQLWDAGFRVVPVLNADKVPLGRDWGNAARRDPPDGVRFQPVAHALNTGVLCDGLRAIDLDIDDPEIAIRCRAVVVTHFGEAPIRMRRNSSRCLILYRAATGEPAKIVLAGKLGKVEVLGRGQQFVAFGLHPSGTELEWFPDPPGTEQLANLPAVTEDGIAELFAELAPIIEAEAPVRANGHDHEPAEPQAEFLRIAKALADLPNTGPPDWERWNRVGMAVWRATGGSAAGGELFNAWSARHPAYDAAATHGRWAHYFDSPPTSLGAGTLFHLAREARASAEPEPEPPPDEQPQPGSDGIPFSTFSDVQEVAELEDFVEDLLVMGAMSIIYGKSNCGKSFFVLDLAMRVASGLPWRGQAVERGAVLYLALEGGQQAIRNRLLAIRQQEGWDGYDLPFAFINVPIDLRNPGSHVEPLIATVNAVAARFAAAECPVRWIIVDTLARAMAGGNENASEDMGALVINCDRLRAVTRCHLTLVHHSGKDEARGARGHSSAGAATDTEIEIVDDEGTRTVTVTKQRDLPTLDAFAFQLRQIEIGTNRRGKPITTCVVEYEGTPSAKRGKGGGDGVTYAARALEVLIDLCAQSGKSGYGAPEGVVSVPEVWWKDRFCERAMPGETDEVKARAFRRVAKQLIGSHRVGMLQNRVWIVQRNSTEGSE